MIITTPCIQQVEDIKLDFNGAIFNGMFPLVSKKYIHIPWLDNSVG